MSYRVVGHAYCGHCGGTFTRDEPAMEVTREERGHEYPELRPWHQRCVDEENAGSHR